MAQVSIPPSPAAMTRRNPLTNLPNAVNSPYQISVGAAGGKRARSQAATQRDTGYPPSKKQATESTVLRTPVRRSQQVETRAIPQKKAALRVRPAAGVPPAFADIGQQSRKPKATTEDQQHQDNVDSVRAWQKHYRNAFPKYVFFFENIADAVIYKAQKHISSLGGRCEKYFSSKVTHVITSRAVDEVPNPRKRDKNQPPRIIVYDDGRIGRGSNDILLKALEYNMKIWPLEKFQRVLNGLLDRPIYDPLLGLGANRKNQPDNQTRATVDLSHLLKNERLHGPTDRDPTVNSKDIHYFKGPYIYVRDMTGACRPIMVREYPKVQRREDGAWPQFRSVSGGKCPFIEEAVHQRRERAEKSRGKEQACDTRERMATRDARPQSKNPANPANTFKQTKEGVSRQPVKKSRALVENGGRANLDKRATTVRSAEQPAKASTSSVTVAKAASNGPSIKRSTQCLENAIAFTSTNPLKPNKYGQEPAASGVQPSNITSAIRSQVVSSHRDQPGGRAGTSKEVYGLQRKVAGNVLLGNPGSKAISTKSTAAAAASASKKRTYDGKEKVAASSQPRQTATKEVARSKPASKPDPRPGYCENCREKFEDFEEHIQSRPHRKFALSRKNWVELDELLAKLQRPPRRQAEPTKRSVYDLPEEDSDD